MTPSSQRARIVSSIGLGVVHLAALVAFAPIAGLPLDDAWIHQVVARTFAETGTLGYAPGQHGAAATSQLWALLLAPAYRLHIDPVRWAFLLNAAASLTSSQLLHAVLSREAPANESGTGASKTTWLVASALASLLACVSGNVLWFAHSGMETCLFVMLSLAAIFAVTSPSQQQRGMVIGGVCAGLVALTRPEAIPLGALLAAHVLWRRRSLRHALLVISPWAICVAVYLGSNLALTGVALPATRAGRTWLWLSSSPSASQPLALAASFFETWGSRLSHYTFATRSFGLWIGLGLAAYGTVRLLKLRNDGLKLLFGWALIHVGIYVVLLPTPGHGGRYQPFLPMLYALTVAMGSIFLIADFARHFGTSVPIRRHATALACLGVVPWIVFGVEAWRDSSNAHVLAVEHIRATEIETGRWIDANLPADARIASFDIGGIGFASRRPVLDIGGLSDEATANRLEDGSMWQLMRAAGATHVVLPSAYEGHLAGDPLDFASRLHLDDNNLAIAMEPLHTVESSRERWLPAVAATWNAAPRQVVYRVTYTGEQPTAHASPTTKPAVRSPMHRSTSSFGWGFPLALFVLFMGMWIHLLARVKATPTSTPSPSDDSMACS